MAQPLMSPETTNRDILFEQIVKVLDHLPAELKEVFVLTHYDGLSLEEVAASTGVDVETAARRLQAAKQVFYRHLRQY